MNSRLTVALVVACSLVGISTANARPPRSFSSTVTRTGPAGGTYTRQANISTNGQGGYQRNVTRTGPNGRSVTTQGQGSYNSATGTYNQSRTITGPNGRSATESRSVYVGGPYY